MNYIGQRLVPVRREVSAEAGGNETECLVALCERRRTDVPAVRSGAGVSRTATNAEALRPRPVHKHSTEAQRCGAA